MKAFKMEFQRIMDVEDPSNNHKIRLSNITGCHYLKELLYDSN